MVRIDGVTMTAAAAANVEAVGISPAVDVARMRAGLSADALLDECLAGAEGDTLDAWMEYVSAIALAAEGPC